MSARRLLARLTGLWAVLLLAYACGGGSSTSAVAQGGTPVPIKLGVINTPALSDLFLLENPPAGLSLQKGKSYTLSTTSFQSSSDVVQGMAAGSLDAGMVGSVAILPAIAKGLGVKFLGEAFEERTGYGQSDWMVSTNSGITSLSQLRGKKIATLGLGTPLYWIGKSYLQEKAGLVENRDYTFVALPFSVMDKALQSGEVAMASMVPPYSSQAEAAGNVRTLFRDTDEQNPFVQTLLAVNSDFAAKHPKAVQALEEDWQKVAEYAADPSHRGAVIAATAAAVKVPASALGFLRTRQDYYYPPHGMIDATALQQNWNWYKRVGGSSESFTVTKYLFPGSASDA